MKYFTDELWSKINSSCPKEREEAESVWEKNLQSYWENFELLQNKLSKKTYDFFENHSFHDCRLVKVELIHRKQGTLNPITVHVVITNQIDTWQITYKCVKKISMNYESGETNYIDRNGFDDWGYDELLVVDEETLSHEILFASGATFLVHFKNKSLLITKAL